ncbi:MAG: ATP-dependent Clp protease ATP-binding subunit ClpX, partial [Eubacterium sp.]|nr:ATP-dependent Clp protease ATP-binding subunit ClpX [Eubacterium sp.]
NAEIEDKKLGDTGDILKQVQPQDFVKYGIIPEFVGRVPMIVTLDQLDEEALVNILVKPKSAITKQYQKLFELDGVELSFSEEALREIAKEAMERNTGARGLRAIIEKSMLDLMYEIPSDDMIQSCVVTKETITDGAEPEKTLRDKPRTRKSRIRQAGVPVG